MLIDHGASVLAVAHRLGHSDPAITLRNYGHLFAGVQEALTDQLDELARAPLAEPSVVAIEQQRRTQTEAS